MAGLVGAPAGIAERGGVRDLHAVAGAHADDVKIARVRQAVHLPFLRRVQCRPRLAGGAAGGLQLHRRRLHFGEHIAIDQAEGRVLFLVFLDVGGVEHRQLDDVVDALDVARFQTDGRPAALVESILPAGHHQVEELLVLERANLVRRPAPAAALEHIRHRVSFIERIPVDRAVIIRQRTFRHPALQNRHSRLQLHEYLVSHSGMARRARPGIQIEKPQSLRDSGLAGLARAPE